MPAGGSVDPSLRGAEAESPLAADALAAAVALAASPDAGAGSVTVVAAIDPGGDCYDPHLSPDCTTVAFVRDGDLWLATADAPPRQLTHHPDGFEYGVEGGSFGYLNNYFTAGKKVGNFEYSLFGSDVRGDGYIGNSWFNTQTVNFLGTLQATPDDRFTFKLINN